MRATERNRRVRTWRSLTGIVAALTIVVAAFGSGIASAADSSRIVFVGTGLLDANGAVIGTNGIPDNDKKLLPTAVTLGGSTKVDVTVLSGDNQNIAHTVLYFPVHGKTLPDGLTVSYVFGPDAGFCVPTGSTSVTSVRCDFGNLAAGTHRTVSILVDVASGFAPPPPPPCFVPPSSVDLCALFTANVETNNENGSNLQTFAATSGAFPVSPATDNTLGSYLAPGLTHKQTKATTGTPSANNKLTTAVTFQPDQADGNLVAITEISDATKTELKYNCPFPTCQPDSTTVEIDHGTGSYSQPPYLDWKLTALVPKTFTLSKAFVAHYLTGSTTSDWQLFVGKKGDACGTSPATTIAAKGHCIVAATLSKPDRTTGLSTFVVELLSDHNGGMRY